MLSFVHGVIIGSFVTCVVFGFAYAINSTFSEPSTDTSSDIHFGDRERTPVMLHRFEIPSLPSNVTSSALPKCLAIGKCLRVGDGINKEVRPGYCTESEFTSPQCLQPTTSINDTTIENVPPPLTTPVIVIVSHNWGDREDIRTKTKAFITSVLRYEPGPVHFVFLTSHNEADEIIDWFLKACNNPNTGVLLEFIALPHDWVVDAVRTFQFVGATPLDHHSGSAGVAKFLLPDILPLHMQRAIVYDADVVLNRPVTQLWAEFDLFGPLNLIASPTLWRHRNNKFGPRAADATCSCLTLMRLDRMREIGWQVGHVWLDHVLFQKNISDGNSAIGIGDQALTTAVLFAHPQIGRRLDHTWILSNCQDYYGVNPKTVRGMNYSGGTDDWGGLHFNCWWYSTNKHAFAIRQFYYDFANSQAFDICAPPKTQPKLVDTTSDLTSVTDTTEREGREREKREIEREERERGRERKETDAGHTPVIMTTVTVDSNST